MPAQPGPTAGAAFTVAEFIAFVPQWIVHLAIAFSTTVRAAQIFVLVIVEILRFSFRVKTFEVPLSSPLL